MPEPYPVGTIVFYRGSLGVGPERRWVITQHLDPYEVARTMRPQIPEDEIPGAYPDGVAYEVWPEGLEQKFGNRMYSVTRVRRDSLTPVPQPEEFA